MVPKLADIFKQERRVENQRMPSSCASKLFFEEGCADIHVKVCVYISTVETKCSLKRDVPTFT